MWIGSAPIYTRTAGKVGVRFGSVPELQSTSGQTGSVKLTRFGLLTGLEQRMIFVGVLCPNLLTFCWFGVLVEVSHVVPPTALWLRLVKNLTLPRKFLHCKACSDFWPLKNCCSHSTLLREDSSATWFSAGLMEDWLQICRITSLSS